MNTNPGRIDKYELQEPLGRDGMTEVWKAFDTQARRYVAIKFLHANLQMDPDFVSRFQRETRAIAALHHPGIVHYEDFSILQPSGTANATAYMVMNYVDGGTLADYIRNTSRQGKFLLAADIVRLFTSIGMAVSYAHQLGVVHGQLKPTNVLLDKRNISRNAVGTPVVTDFGILKLLGVTAGATANTGGWRSASIPLYTSPEQIMGSPADERSDVYSLGIMLYEISTGTPPFLGNNPAAIMMQHINTIPTLPTLINPDLPVALSTVIMRSIAKDPWARFNTASAFVEALVQAVEAVGQKEIDVSTLSIPANANEPDYSVKSMDLPTVLTGQPLPAGPYTPSSPAISGVSFSPDPLGSPQPSVVGYGPGLSPPWVVQSAPLSSIPPTLHSSPPPPRKTREKRLWVALTALLILVLVGSGLGAFFALFSKGAHTTASAPAIVGHAYFVSSGLLNLDPGSNQGISDQLQINLENIPPSQQGKSYFAWLLSEEGQDWQTASLGSLTVSHGAATLFFQGDAAHSNELATHNRFLITEENTTPAPISPSLDTSTWRYFAEFSPTPNPADPEHHSLFDHIRHLLSNDPKVGGAGLTGGLDIWLYRNTQSILAWANSARDAQNSGNVGLIRRQLTRIIDYLDGTYYNQHDLPGVDVLGVLNNTQKTVAKIGLLTFDAAKQVNNPGYLYHIGIHLHEISLLPQTSAQQRSLAIQINSAINGVSAEFQAIRSGALQLYNMPDTQLLGSSGRTLLNSVALLANDAFIGQINAQGQVTEGVVQIHYDIQRLATFDVRACTSSDPCSLTT